MEEHPAKSLNSIHFGHGTHFGKRGIVRIKLSDKDLVLIAGIVVAAIIALTTIWLDSNVPKNENREQGKPTVTLPSASVLFNKIGNDVIQELAR